MTLIPVAIFWILLTLGLIRPSNKLHLYLLFGTMGMGSFAVVPIALSGGMTLTGPPVVAAAMLFKSFYRIGAIGDYLCSAVELRRLGLLSMFWVVACAVTFFAPRYFLYDVEIIPMKLKSVGVMGSDVLTPTKQNISQMLYITISVLSVFMFSHLFRSPRSYQEALKAFRFGASVVVFTGVLDFLSLYLPINVLLEAFRTGGYALMTDKVVNGYKRVVGLMPEASAFGSICLFFLCFLYFSRFLLESESHRSKTCHFGIMLALALMLVLSMSSSAYVGLAVFALMAVLEWFARSFTLPANSLLRTGLEKERLICLAGIALVAFTVAAAAPVRDEIFTRVDRLIFCKTESSSYEERSMWTEVSWQSLWDTYGIGCGLGSTRASNRCVSIFSNTGLLGGLLFYGFTIQTLLRKSGRGLVPKTLMHSIRWSFLPIFVFDFLVGTTPDFGLANAWMYGMATGIFLQSEDPKILRDEFHCLHRRPIGHRNASTANLTCEQSAVLSE